MLFDTIFHPFERIFYLQRVELSFADVVKTAPSYL